MAELLLINPGRKVKKKKGKKRAFPQHLKKYFFKKGHKRPKAARNPVMAKKKHRSAAQKAATRKMLAARRGLHVTHRRKANPIKRHARRAYTVGKSRIRRRKMNPIGGRFSLRDFMQHTLMPSTIGAAGALGMDMVLGFLPLPPAMKTGTMKTFTKIAGAAAFGIVASNFIKRSTAEQIAAGAITVALYDLIKGFTLPMLPPTVQASINSMAGIDDFMEEYPALAYAGAGMTVDGDVGDVGEYVSGDGVGMYVE